MQFATIRRYALPVPRYTSYPTAPHFSPRVSELHYVDWLSQVQAGAKLSLYVHVPFCHQLCWYCGCNTKATRRYAPVSQYVRHLKQEITNLSQVLAAPHGVAHLHWGGGSPNILAPRDIEVLAATIFEAFQRCANTEFAVEIDPRHLTADHVEAFRQVGVNRVSIGVQDFDGAVQAAIGRQQSFSETQRAIDAFRERGVASVNIDLIYGLPSQSRQSLERTLQRVIALAPDRIAAFGYAHLPKRLPQQRLIDEAALPDAIERFGQANRIARRLCEHGYVRIGLDHFAKGCDALAQGPVRRNFQGYTNDTADVLLGVGASAIGRLPQGYVQNAVAAGEYMRRIKDYGLATARGLELTVEDKARAFVIESLMCRLQFSESELRGAFGAAADAVCGDAKLLLASNQDQLLESTADGFIVTERGRPFLRSICACFDANFGLGKGVHASGV